MSITTTHQRRYARTLRFMEKHLEQGSRLLDLGVENPFTPQLKNAGYAVQNTQGENLDDDFQHYDLACRLCDSV